MKRLTILTALCLACVMAKAQKMQFTFGNLSGVKSEYLHDGTTLVQLPAGSSLSSLSNYGMSVTCDGNAATLSDIVPNPSTKTDYVDGGLNVFYYKGKAYKVRFAVGEYFTAVMFSDAKLGSASSLSKADLVLMADRITKMGTANGAAYEFDALPGYTPKTDIAFYLGDMNSTTSQIPVVTTLNDAEYMNIVNKCAVVAGRIEATGTAASVTEYGLCLSKNANPTTSDTSKAASDLGVADATFGDFFENVFAVYFDDLDGNNDAGGVTYHYRAYVKYTLTGSNTVYTTYGEDRTFTTPGVSGFHWQWEGGTSGDATMDARIEEAMNGASYNYNHYCTFYKWCGVGYGSGTPTADCSLRQDGSCYMRFGPNERYQWVGTAQHEINHGYGVGQTGAYAGYPNPFQFRRATLTIRTFLRNMESEVIYHDGMHYWPGGINQREEVTNGTANAKGTYTCYNDEMLRCNAMILNGLILDGMQNWYGWAKERRGDDFGEEEAPRRVSQSQNASATDFEDALDAFNQAGIPLILAPGDLDLAATANNDGYTLNGDTYNVITRSITEAQTHGVTDLSRFSGTSLSNTVQPQPYAFLFKGVRFYNGMKFWFDKPMYKYSNSSYRFLTPDQILSNLTTYVGNHSSETSIWLQHIPFAADDNTWLDNTGTVYRYSNGTTAYTNYNATYNAYNTAARRRSKLATLINSTANHAMFSGNSDVYNDNNYNSQFHDYTVKGLNNTPCDAYIVLMKAGTGVVEVKQVSFRDYEFYATQKDDPTTEYPAGSDNSKLAGLVQGITNLNTGDSGIASALTTATNANTAAAVTSAITNLNNAFTTWAQGGGNLNVSGLLGSNLDFETASTTVTAQASFDTTDHYYSITGWNEWLNAPSTTNATMRCITGLGSSNGGYALQLRDSWQTAAALPTTIQVYKDAVLPAGTYQLSFEMRQPDNSAQEWLNYYEVNGQRVTFSAGTTWETKTLQIKVTEPSTLRLSFGFVGSTVQGYSATEVDIDNVTLTRVTKEVTQGKAGLTAADGWTQITALPQDYSPYFFTLYDHTQDLGLLLKTGNHQGNGYQTMWYTSGVTPGLDKTALWTFDSNVDGETEYVVMANATYPDYMMQTEWNAAYFYRTHDNGGGSINWGRTLVSYADSKWTVQNGYYPNEGYLGPWDNAVENNAEVALNKQDNNIGYFDIYSILRGQYVANYENLDIATDNNPLNISYVLENPGGERNMDTIGWKQDGADWWTQNSDALGGVGKVGTYFLESWNGNGLEATDLYQEISGLPDGIYRFSAIARCSSDCYIYANEEQTLMPENEGAARKSVVITLNGGGNNTLRVGAKTGTNPGSWIAFDDAKLEYLGVLSDYNVGSPTINIAESDYIQSLETVTFTYKLASSSEAGATFAILNSNGKATLNQGNTTVAQGTLSLSGKTLTATFSNVNLTANSNYTLTLPAGVVGYAGEVSNDAVTLTLHTPLVFDGTFYLYNTYTQNYLTRGGQWATAAIMDDWGLAMILETDNKGATTLKYFDSMAYVYNDGYCFGDGATGHKFTMQQATGGYKFLCQSNNKYFAVYNGRTVNDAEEGVNLVGTSNVWALEPLANHSSAYIACADAQAVTAATAASLTGISTKAALDAKVASDYIAEEVTVTGEKAERFQWYAATADENTPSEYYKETVTGLEPGLYRLSVDAFQRAAYYADVAAAGGARGAIYVYANDAKTQIKSVMEYAQATAYNSDFEYNGGHYPNNENSGYDALDTGNYQNVVYVYVPADAGETTGTLTFGINNPNRLGNVAPNRGTWCVFENFKLEKLIPMVILDETAANAPASATNVVVKFVRTIAARDAATESNNAWNTICFPFAMDENLIKETFGDNTVVKELKSVVNSGENASLQFKAVTNIVANTPYIMQTDNDGSVQVDQTGNKFYILRGINVTPDDNLTVTVDGLQFIGNYIYPCVMSNTNGEDYYLLNDVIKHSSGRTKIKGYRAYFHIPTGSPVKALAFNPMDEEETTGVDGLLINDEESTIYDVAGRKLTTLNGANRGVYIVNGKKVFVK